MRDRALLGLGRNDEALPRLLEVAGHFAQLEDSVSEAQLWRQIARGHDRSGDAPQALSAWRRVAVLCGGEPPTDLEAAVGIALTARRAGLRAEEVRSHHLHALRLATAANAAAAEHTDAARGIAEECADGDLITACGQLVSADSSV